MDKAGESTIEVSVVYALSHQQIVETLRLPAGATVGQAIARSGLLTRYPKLSAATAVGIFGRRAETSDVLREFDRIEIYRALIADPKQARRRRARGKEKRTP